MPENDTGKEQMDADELQKGQPADKSGTGDTQSEGTTEPAQTEIDLKALREELTKQRELAKHHLDQWKRSAADLENYRKRVQKEREELARFGDASLIGELLPTLDDFERAFQTLPPSLSTLTWTQGITLIAQRLRMILEQHGLEEVEALGKPFDPMQHQAVMEEETDEHPDRHVVAVLQKGYAMHDRVLRPAMVKVSRNEAAGKTETPEDAEVDTQDSTSTTEDKPEQ